MDKSLSFKQSVQRVKRSSLEYLLTRSGIVFLALVGMWVFRDTIGQIGALALGAILLVYVANFVEAYFHRNKLLKGQSLELNDDCLIFRSDKKPDVVIEYSRLGISKVTKGKAGEIKSVKITNSGIPCFSLQDYENMDMLLRELQRRI